MRHSANGYDILNYTMDDDLGEVAVHDVPGSENLIIAELSDGTLVLCDQWRMKTSSGGEVENLYLCVFPPLYGTVEDIVNDVRRLVAEGKDPADGENWLFWPLDDDGLDEEDDDLVLMLTDDPAIA